MRAPQKSPTFLNAGLCTHEGVFNGCFLAVGFQLGFG